MRAREQNANSDPVTSDAHASTARTSAAGAPEPDAVADPAVRTDATTRTGQPPGSTPVDFELTGPLSIVAKRRVNESALTVFPVALGGSTFGWTADADTSTQILDRFSDLGGNLIDTADSYASGRSELIIGGWLRARRNRDHVIVSTKIGRNADNPGLGSVSMIRAVEASLARLGTDHIDILSFHDEDSAAALEDSLATAEWLIETGKVRYLSAANFSAERLIEARILSSTGLPQFVSIQTHYNLMHRAEFEGDVRIVAAAQSLAVMPYASLAGGYLSGKYRSKDAAGHSPRAANALSYLGRKGNRVLTALNRVAAMHQTSPASIALAWLLAKRNVTAAIAGASRPEQVDGMMKAAGVRLTRAQMLELDRVSD
ncbi:MAG: aldo/keto reductase [Microbacteriaceae bacterium]|nr:MAG: aldo/keto reductase [Microbacteriaceae bacterium]